MRLYTIPLFSVSFSDDHRATSDEQQETNQPEIFSPLGKKLRHKPWKCLSKYMDITQDHEEKGSKRGVRRWKMTPGVGGLQRA